MIVEGDSFPSFSLPDENGKIVSSDDLRGKSAVIYFYPKDDTTGCTAEACEFRDTLPGIDGVTILGVSPDNPRSHRKFVDKYSLNFTLLADTEQALCKAAGVWAEKSMYGKKYMGVERSTFVLDGDGKVVKVFRKVKPQGHAAEVKAIVESLGR
ncbi:MAG: thioredoxin-dependent thiol peroxidase [Fimbriimonas sp.]|nr:thioredoxin-dependent thiol peroxidase [Fimbriimonas sp.]